MAKDLRNEDIKTLFKKFDNGNGHLSLAEIDRAVTHFYPELGVKKNAMMRAYKAADASGNGLVELKEFRQIIHFLYYYKKLSEVFDEMDTDDDHRVDFSEFKKGIELLGEDTDDENFLRREFNKIDTNRGGFILFDEFCAYMAKRKL